MTGVCKLLFDISVYGALAVFYASLFQKGRHLPLLLACLFGAALVSLLVRRAAEKKRRAALLPFCIWAPLALLLCPEPADMLPALPLGAYLGYCILTDRVDMDYDAFRSHFVFAGRLLLLLLPGLLFSPQRWEALRSSAPFLVLTVTLGAAMLRLKRAPEGRLRSELALMALCILFAAAFAYADLPRRLLQAAGLMYRYVLSPLILLLAAGICLIFYGLYLVLRLILNGKTAGEQPELTLSSAAELLGMEDTFSAYTVSFARLRTALTVLGILLLLYTVFRILRRWVGERPATQKRAGFTETVRSAERVPRPGVRFGLLAPAEPRLAVRYYYRRFLLECRRRQIALTAGMTVTEVVRQSRDAFPGADPEDIARMYAPARYAPDAAVTRREADEARAAYRRLRSAPFPSENAKK